LNGFGPIIITVRDCGEPKRLDRSQILAKKHVRIKIKIKIKIKYLGMGDKRVWILLMMPLKPRGIAERTNSRRATSKRDSSPSDSLSRHHRGSCRFRPQLWGL
jgi:hypothetical protein